MSKNRRTVAIDAEIAEELSRYAKERGMSLAGYIRSVFTSVIQAERSGMYPPNLMKEAVNSEVLKKLGFLLVPSSFILEDVDESRAEEIGVSIGKALSEISPEPIEVFERYTLSMKVAFPKDSYLFLPPVRGNGGKIRRLIIGMAKGLGLEVHEEDEIAKIVLKRQES